MLDHSIEEENELLNSVRAQLSKLEREMETQLQDDREYTISQNSHGQGPRIPGPKTLDGTNSAKRPR